MTTPVTPAASRTTLLIRPALGLIAAICAMLVLTVLGTFVAAVSLLPGVDLGRYSWALSFSLVVLCFHALAAMAGGFIAGRVARGQSVNTVLALAVLAAVSGIVPVVRGVRPVNGQPAWFPVAIAFLVPAAVLLGGVLERRRRAAA